MRDCQHDCNKRCRHKQQRQNPRCGARLNGWWCEVGNSAVRRPGRRTSVGRARWRVNRLDESIATFGNCFNETRAVGIIAERQANLLDAVIESLFEIDKGFRSPELVLEFLPGHQLSCLALDPRRTTGDPARTP